MSRLELETLEEYGTAHVRAIMPGLKSRALPADRTGLGHVSGGDVEICYRITSTGRPLYYSPQMRIDHVVALKRQHLRSLLGLARGLGAGAELVDLMGARDPESWPAQAHRTLAEEMQRHWAAARHVVTRQYPWRDWLIRAAFLSERRAQNRALARDGVTRNRLGGVRGRPTVR